jgi:hypothetical protein
MTKCIQVDVFPGKNIGTLEIEMGAVFSEKPISDKLYDALKKAILDNPDLVKLLDEEFKNVPEDPMLIGTETFQASLRPSN